ncbi:DUF2637 domain-containing protein [Streptomyces sp. NBC_01242]|uniref:DUF2637 domain-containing protein n=1 Tax=Streptomyces sp. NBC_01242 TaxID=2903795 RepID=UPI002255487F|nr:DUF2637 domain-containing protein [Streptomyces sp. NBC_01242]MCX4799666.1 DUF2637 domain-containing protein [Streptomyces sp. NBC_01242]
MAHPKRTRNNSEMPAPETGFRARLTQIDWDKALTDGMIYLLALGGFYVGYQTLYSLALYVGFPQDQAVVVASLADLAILAYSRKAVQEVNEGRSAWGIRAIVTVFSLGTFALQIRAAWPDPIAVIFHALPPAVWIIGHEMMLRGKLRRAKKARREREIAQGLRPARLPSIRRVHWVLDPRNTFKVWRRMKLWELPQHVVVRQLADGRAAEKKAIPAAWQGILLTPVPLAQQEPLKELEAAEPEDEDEATVMWRCFLQALPPVPPEGRSKEEARAYIERVEQLAGEFGVDCSRKTIANQLGVDPSYVSRICPAQKEPSLAGS